MAHVPGHIDYISQIQQAMQNQVSGSQQQNYGGQTSQYQSPMDALSSMFSPFGVSTDDLTKYSGFIGDIPEELYGLTDPNADIYKQFRSERQQRLIRGIILWIRTKFIYKLKTSKGHGRKKWISFR